MSSGNVLSAGRVRDRHRAVSMVTNGEIVGASFGTVYGIIGDGHSHDLDVKVAGIKGQQRLGRPLSVCLPESRFSQLLDPSQIHPAVRGMALDGHALSRTLSSLAFVRAPIRASVAQDLPAQLVSVIDGVPYLQSLDPGGLPGARTLMNLLWHAGVRFPAITSMNSSGQPEIVSYPEALRFSNEHGLAALLRPRSQTQQARGSFSILEIGPHGLRAARHGVIPVPVLQRLVEPPIDDTLTQMADHPPLDLPAERLEGLNRYATCRAALLSLNTSLPTGLIRPLARFGLSHPWPSLRPHRSR
jgi:hypothetical protein